jgi:Tfp pilus assembly protein FimT
MLLIKKALHTLSHAGYSALEVMTVVSIMGILSVSSVTGFSHHMQNERINAAASALASELSAIRMRAVATSTPLTVEFKTGLHFVMFNDLNANNTADAEEPSTDYNLTTQFPGITITSSAPVVFYPRGTVMVSVLMLSNATKSRYISLSNAGSITIQ